MPQRPPLGAVALLSARGLAPTGAAEIQA